MTSWRTPPGPDALTHGRDCSLSPSNKFATIRARFAPEPMRFARCVTKRRCRGGDMKLVDAKVLDATRLELTSPISVAPGESIRIAIPEEGEDASVWRERHGSGSSMPTTNPMPSTTVYEFGEIVLVDFPQTSRSEE